MYNVIFQDRDPVSDPGTATGTPGNWWTVFALVPDIFQHAVQGFGLYASPSRLLDPLLRELGQLRAGWNCRSQFVFSQHCKEARELGISEAKISAIPGWGVSEQFSPIERAVLAYTDALAFDRGRVDDAVFAALQEHLTDEQILELTYITSLYILHANMCNALRLEYDDVPERVIEIGGGTLGDISFHS
ncbi:MAG TPA: carboxymuconolactone decarboxylase family protein [Acidimicrobiales bacterium]|nr:carboxymuconolactone decarboxylase family protein [Acidimicrobiales bacterium]